MATYAEPQDVLDSYEGTASTGFVQVHLDRAERELLRQLRQAGVDLPARVAAGDVAAIDITDVLVDAVKRYLRNPEGYTYETAGDRAVNRGAAGSPAVAGRITFLPDELARFKPEPTGPSGWGTVFTPRAGAAGARSWDGRR